jgi:predicted ribosome quality control (RQC) complex YloA/Tae2 family protein
MITNYFIQRRITEELAPHITGKPLDDAFTMHPDELRLVFDDIILRISTRPANAFIHFRSGDVHIRSRNVKHFFSQLYGKIVSGIRIAPADRFIRLELDSARIDIRLYNGPNVIAYYDTTAELFKKEPKTPFDDPFAADAKTPSLGNILIKEAAYRNTDLLPELLSGSGAYIGQTLDGMSILAPLPLMHRTVKDWKYYGSANDAVREYLQTERIVSKFASEKTKHLHFISDEINAHKRSLEQAERSLQDFSRADRYQSIASELLARHDLHLRGTETFLTSTGEQIALDPSLSIYDNAQLYFSKAKTSRERKKETLARAKSLRERIARSESALSSLYNCSDPSQLTEWKQTFRDVLAAEIEKSERQSKHPFREFKLRGNYIALVGKNAKQNDELTLRYAKKDDIWLHARDVAGSHVVIPHREKNKPVPKEVIEEAASIALFYSDAKSQPLAPVSYTFRKFVRKPKGSAPGAVRIEREDVIITAPKNPNEQ